MGRCIAGGVLILAACGPGEAVAPSVSTTAGATTSSTTTTTTVPDPTPSSTTPRRQPIDDGELPGDPSAVGVVTDLPVAVVGVQFDDVLNVRLVPGVDHEIVGELAPTQVGITTTGRARDLGQSTWYEVELPDGPGWANASFLGYRGPTTDATSVIVARIGSTPAAPTMEELGLAVARAVASTDPPSAITVTAPAATGDLGEVIYDVVGLGDDAIWAIRLHVFGRPDDAGFALASVEQTLFCARGLSPEGLCP